MKWVPNIYELHQSGGSDLDFYWPHWIREIQEDLEGGRNRFWHRKDMKPLCMQKTSFLQTAIKPTQANITLKQIHLLLLINIELCMLGILQRLNLNMKFQF